MCIIPEGPYNWTFTRYLVQYTERRQRGAQIYHTYILYSYIYCKHIPYTVYTEYIQYTYYPYFCNLICWYTLSLVKYINVLTRLLFSSYSYLEHKAILTIQHTLKNVPKLLKNSFQIIQILLKKHLPFKYIFNSY